jgi:signal peptidase I
MVPTLLPGDRVLADRLSLDFGDPHRYQIVVFHPPHCSDGNSDGMGVCTSPDRKFRDGLAGTTFIKRVIGLPGETVWSQGGKIWVQDPGKPKFSLDEPYVNDHQEIAGRALTKVTIPKGYYLLMGDNRGISDDSRDWGLEPRNGIIGVARARYWPIRRIGSL